MGEVRDCSYRTILKKGIIFLEESGIEEAELDAWLLFSYVTGFSRADYFLHSEEVAKQETEDKFFALLERRKTRVPLAYIVENMDFMGFSFFVNENVLIPNQDTETLVEEALKLSEGREILDLCTGSGCIGISLALLGSPKSVEVSDISKEALAVVKENVRRLQVEEKVPFKVVESDLFQDIIGEFDLIVSNPPYIKTSVLEELAPEVKDYEPRLALDGDIDGLKFYKEISFFAPRHLRRGGYLMLEIGYDQANEVCDLLEEAGFSNIKVVKDLTGKDRVVIAELLR